jgi:hypothetical protein
MEVKLLILAAGLIRPSRWQQFDRESKFRRVTKKKLATLKALG